MQLVSKRPISVVDGLNLDFPTSRCCNCGATTDIHTLHQDTRITRYLFGGGSEFTFQFSLPYCSRCEASAKRRPPGFLGQGLVLLLSFAVVGAVLILVGDLLHSTFIAAYLAPLAAVIALVFTASFYVFRKPGAGQTSYYQPVRVTKLGQEFVSGKVKMIRLMFTNSEYRSEFMRSNESAIGKRLIEVAT